MTSEFYVIYYGYVMPHIFLARNRLEIFNEVMIMFVNYMMIFFTNYNLSETVKFYAGYVFVAIIGITIVVNFGLVMKNIP
jgi:hypothetical protein